MKLFLNTFLEAAHAALQKPDELAGFAGQSRIAYIVPALSALSTSVAAYLLRDYYESIFLVNILVTTLLQTAAYIMYGLMFSALVDFFVERKHEDRTGKAQGVFLIFLYCLLPLVFSFPIAAIARVTPSPMIVSGIGSLLLHLWCAASMVRAFQYYYELPLRDIMAAMGKALAATAGFPVILFLLMSFRFIASL